MGLSYPWDEYKNKLFFPNMKIKQTTLIYNTKHLQEINQMVLCTPPLMLTLTNKTKNLKNLSNYPEANKCIDGESCNNRTGTLATTFHKIAG